jgi:DNA-binding PadR family transcriptional regulator
MGRPKKYFTLEEAHQANVEKSKKYIQDNYDKHKEKQREKQREKYRKDHPNAKTYKKHPIPDASKKSADLLDTNVDNIEDLPKNTNENPTNI